MVDVKWLIRNLENANGLTIEFARSDLKNVNDPAAVLELIEGLGHRYSEVRAYCAMALGNIGDKRAVPALCKNLKAPGFSGSCAAKALGKIRDGRAIEPLIGALGNYEKTVRAAAATALGAIGNTLAVSALKASTKDEEYQVRVGAIEALGDIAANNPDALERREIIDFLTLLLEEDNMSAAIALGEIGDISAVPALAAAAKKRGVFTPEYAARALGNIEGEAATFVLVGILGSKNKEAVSKAKEALIEKGSSAVPALITGLRSGESLSVREKSWEVLWKINPSMQNLKLVRRIGKELREAGATGEEYQRLYVNWSKKLSKKADAHALAEKKFPIPKAGKPDSFKRITRVQR